MSDENRRWMLLTYYPNLRWTYFQNLYDFSVIDETEALSAMLGN